jgi:hypothetical protein
MRALIAVPLSLTLLAGCASTHRGDTMVVKTDAEHQADLLDRVKTLAGEWEMEDEKGVWSVSTVFSVSSNGSVVREVMFPGSPHEMTNMYHMDGNSLVMTHYCAMGNQPRMRATQAVGNSIPFTFDSVTNYNESHTGYMGAVTLVFESPDRIVQQWQNTDKATGKPGDHAPGFVLRRKKA